MKKTAKSALKQIDDENYSEGLKYEGYKEIVKIGMEFGKKDMEVVVEEE
ncbi:PD-(D/E)XK nuclease domain-containing protein [Leptotrichia shahii]|nr:PD-(D/E)XK nuclease domain-containing protein [Leptotrichia shahii]